MFINLRLSSIIITLLSAVVFMLVLYLSSFFIVNGNFGTSWVFDLYFSRIIESFILLLFSAFVVDRFFWGSKNPSRIVFFSYYIFLLVPLLVIYGLRVEFAARQFVYMVMLCFFISIIISQCLPRIKFPRFGRGISYVIFFMLVVATIYVYACLIFTGGLSKFNFNLYKVYEVRSELDFSILPFFGYLLPWQAHVVNMVFLVFGFLKRSKTIIVSAFVLQMVLFGMTNFKSFLLAPVLVILLYAISKRNNLFVLMLWGAIVTLIISTMFFFYTDEIIIPSLFIRRLFLVPANIHFWYYDFFSGLDNPHVFLSNSFLSLFSSYPYDMPITTVISWKYLNNLDGGINVGYLGDAYTHFGLMGMIVFSVVLGFFLNIVDSVSTKIPANISLSIIAIPAMALVNSAFFTTLLTHGLFMAFVCLYMLRGMIDDKKD